MFLYLPFKGLEQTVVTADDGEEEFTAAHIGSCSFHGFVELRKWLSKGPVLLDLPCSHIDDVVARILRSLGNVIYCTVLFRSNNHENL
jgi:hypothetical protein